MKIVPDKMTSEMVAAAQEFKLIGAPLHEDMLQRMWTAILAAAPVREEAQPVAVWYGSMPESNGRQNWTAILRRVNPTDKWDQGFCFARSEYPGRVRYEADRMRWIIGELAEKPDILAYDADAHSGYVTPTPPAPESERLRVAVEKMREQYKDQMKYCEPEALQHFREFVYRLDQALAALQKEGK